MHDLVQRFDGNKSHAPAPASALNASPSLPVKSSCFLFLSSELDLWLSFNLSGCRNLTVDIQTKNTKVSFEPANGTSPIQEMISRHSDVTRDNSKRVLQFARIKTYLTNEYGI